MNINSLVNTGMLEKVLDAQILRNDAISQNIANADTPLYKRKFVNFEEALGEELSKSTIKGKRTNGRHIPIGEVDYNNFSPEISEDNSRNKMRMDGNNVDINKEMSDMSQNTLKYNAIIQKISGEFKRMKSVISEGRK